MDTKEFEKYGIDIRCYRLRTARQKKRIQYKNYDKWLIKQHKVKITLWKKERNPTWIPLDPPVQKGWKRSFILRHDVAESKQAAFFEVILQKINTIEWSYRKDFKVKRRKFGRKIYVVKEQPLRRLYDHEFQRLNFSGNERQFFYPTFKYVKGRREPVIIYLFTEPWRFVLKVSPNMVTRQRMVDPDLQSAIANMENRIERNDLDKRQGRILNGVYQYWRHKQRRRHEPIDPLKNKSIHRFLEDLKNEMI